MPEEIQTYFTPTRIAELRREVEQQGLVPDALLSENPDSRVFGLNLACAYPFPRAIASAYDSLAAKLSALDAGAYVYPHWETHITIATFVNFTRHKEPTADALAELATLPQLIIREIQSLEIRPFILRLDPPILTRKAAIIPISDLNGEIPRIRAAVLRLIQEDFQLHEELRARGLTIPEIIHSTIMRFPRLPADQASFVEGFQRIAATTRLGEIEVADVLLTEETKPYMREGRILWRSGAGTP